jgi:hypothetical protein
MATRTAASSNVTNHALLVRSLLKTTENLAV